MLRNTLISLMATLSLVACFPEPPAAGNDDTDDSIDSGDDGLSADILVTTSPAEFSNYPLAVKAQITATAGSSYVVKLGDAVVESGNMPSNALLQGPASGITDGNNKRLVYFVIGESGSQSVSVAITKDGETVTDSESLPVGGVAPVCQSNESFYQNESLSGNFTCGNCHNAGGTASFTIDGTSLTTISSTPKFNGTDAYVFANMPANLDRTPGDNTLGGEYIHSGGQRWGPDSTAHLRVLELAYRIRNNFSCP